MEGAEYVWQEASIRAGGGIAGHSGYILYPRLFKMQYAKRISMPFST